MVEKKAAEGTTARRKDSCQFQLLRKRNVVATLERGLVCECGAQPHLCACLCTVYSAETTGWKVRVQGFEAPGSRLVTNEAIYEQS